MTKPLILVVDDEKAFADTVKEVIERSGRYSARTAYSGEDALKLITEHNKGLFKRDRIQLVLLDIRMPGMSGIKALQFIREIDPALKAVMVTAYNEDEYWYEAALSGVAIDFLVKPPTPEILMQVLDTYFQNPEQAAVIKKKYAERETIKRLQTEKAGYQNILATAQKAAESETSNRLASLAGDVELLKKRLDGLDQKFQVAPPET